MKFAHVTLFALSTVLAATFAAPARAGGKECLLASQGSDVATIQGFVDDAMDATIVAVMSGQSPDKQLDVLSDMVALESQIVVYSEAECLVLHRLLQDIEDMRLRAQRWVAREIDLFQLRQEIYLARVERAVSTQEALWVAGVNDSTTARAVITSLHEEAFTYVTAPQFGQIRDRLADAIELATAIAHNEIARMQAVHQFYEYLYVARSDAADERFGANDLEGVATMRDVERIVDTEAALFTLITHPTPYACGS